MPKPPLLKEILRGLKENGFVFVSQNGSHAKFRSKTKPVRTVILPIHGKEVPYGTFTSILRQASLTEEEFFGRE